jgi:hypothetical protein
MLRKLLNDQYLYLEAEDDQGGGGAPAVDEDVDTDDNTDTEDNEPEDVAALLAAAREDLAKQKRVQDKQEAALRRKYERELKKKQKELEDLKTKSPDPESEPEPEAADADKTKAMTQAQKRAQRELEKQRQQLEKLQRDLEIAEARREEGERARKDLEKKSLLNRAIQSAGVLQGAGDVAFAYFKDKVVWDEDFGEWAFKVDEDNYVPVDEAISERMPDFLKPRKSRSGSGGGNLGAGPRGGTTVQKQLVAAKQLLAEIIADRTDGGRNAKYNMKHYHDQKKVVADLEKQAK